MHSQHVDDRNFTEETVVCSVVVRPKFTYEFLAARFRQRLLEASLMTS